MTCTLGLVQILGMIRLDSKWNKVVWALRNCPLATHLRLSYCDERVAFTLQGPAPEDDQDDLLPAELGPTLSLTQIACIMQLRRKAGSWPFLAAEAQAHMCPTAAA